MKKGLGQSPTLGAKVHGLSHKHALCGFTDHPYRQARLKGPWPQGHRGVDAIRSLKKINCEICKPRAAKLCKEHLEAERAVSKARRSLAATT